MVVVLLANSLLPIPVLLQQAETPTPTPEIPTEVTPTIEVTETPTPELTETPLETPTETPTEDPILIVETPIFSETLTETPTTSPTASITPTMPVDLAPVTLTLSHSPRFIAKDGWIKIKWQLECDEKNKFNAESNYKLSVLLPTGFIPDEFSTFERNPQSGAVLYSVEKEHGEIDLFAPVDQPGPFEIRVDVVTSDQVLTSETIFLERAEKMDLDSKGGEFKALNDQLRIFFSEKTLKNKTYFWIKRPHADKQYMEEPVGDPFEIIAEDIDSGEEITKFDNLFQIDYQYDESSIPGNEASLKLYYYDEVEGFWMMLPSWTDTENNVIHAYSNHLTIMAPGADDFQANNTPTLDGFQASGFTGAATYSMPLKLPAGPGGLQPNLTLSYNSQIIDEATTQSQASWVGMGWSLDTPRISRNMRGTTDLISDDTFSISMDGFSGTLIKDSSGYYHSTSESFWRVFFNEATQVWTVWDKTGNEYTFIPAGDFPRFSPWNCGSGGNPNIYEGRSNFVWVLSTVKTPFTAGNSNLVLNYYYATETKVQRVYRYCDGYDNFEYERVTAVYPSAIVYPHNRYRIDFVREARTDYDNADVTNLTDRSSFERTRLKEVVISHDTYGNGTFELIRKYAFTYETDPANLIWPNVTWKAGGKTGTLKSVQEYGANGGTLPATTFTYGDFMHLTKAENGYGGAVEFTYERWFEDQDTVKGWKQEENVGVWPNSCWDNTNQNGLWTSISHPSIGCSGAAIGVTDTAGKWVGTTDKTKGAFTHPGGVYKVFATFKQETSRNQYVGLLYRINPGPNEQWGAVNGPVYNSGTTVSANLLLPATASILDLSTITCQGGSCELRGSHYIALMPTRYRVTQKKLYDKPNGTPVVQTYRYDEPAMSDAAHSADVASPHNFLWQPYSEFRGHAQVTVLTPDDTATPENEKLATTTFYHQDDQKKGMSSTVLTYREDIQDSFGTLNTNRWDLASPSNQSISYRWGDPTYQAITAGNWDTTATRKEYSLKSGEAVMLQFRLSGVSARAAFSLETGSGNGYRRWGGIIDYDAANGNRQFFARQSCVGENNCPPGNVMINSTTFALDKWYVLLLILDDTNGYSMRVWERDNPTVYSKQEILDPGAKDKDWHFKIWTATGTLWVDEYMEGQVFNLQRTSYGVQNFDAYRLSPSLKIVPPQYRTDSGNLHDYEGVTSYWVYPTTQATVSFENGSQFIGTKEDFYYDPGLQMGVQLGNQTNAALYAWNGQSWYGIRYSRMRYIPNISSSLNLVGLPAYEAWLKCNNGSCDLANSPADLLSQTVFIYDANTRYDQAPGSGKLSAKRVMLNKDPGVWTNQKFSDEKYTFDAWGNRVGVTVYTGEGTNDATGAVQFTGSPRVSTTAYDSIYHTYPVAQTNPEDQTSTVNYDYRLGVPVGETGISGFASRTRAEYDQFGRILNIYKPGDTSPSFQVTYHDPFPLTDDDPFRFWTEAKQLIAGSSYYTVRKFYDGMGRLVQTQKVNIEVDGVAGQDIVIDTTYDKYGRVKTQSVPYAVSTGTGYLDPESEHPQTFTNYDILGRPLLVEAPDETTQSFSYATELIDEIVLSKTTTTDANGHVAVQYKDALGQLVASQPATGPSVTYEYDPKGQLVEANYGPATTTLNYDLAGRKTSMTDADMGAWSYTYNAMGNLVSQTDARGCVTGLNYDALNRLTGKAYTNCPTTTAPTYTYGTESASRIDEFTEPNLPSGWAQSGPGVTVNGGLLNITSSGSWQAAYRTAYQVQNKIYRFKFRLSGTNLNGRIYIESGTSGNPDYRRWGLSFSGTSFSLQKMEGTSVVLSDLMPFIVNNWYELTIEVKDGDRFRILVRDATTGAVAAEKFEYLPGFKYMLDGVTLRSWRQVSNNHTGTLQIETYKEIDPSGNLGQRVLMTDGSGSTTWNYDGRGRVTSESKTVSGQSFTTSYTYNSADMPVTMTYPDGEIVSFGYNPNMLSADTVSGTIQGTTTNYVTNMVYDVASRMTNLAMGNGVSINRTYNPWDQQGGRLQSIIALVGQTTLQDLDYSYDSVGNITNIIDSVANENSVFIYDPLNSFLSASGAYTDAPLYDSQNTPYRYDNDTGNLLKANDVTLTYGNSAHIHAVTSTSDGNTYGYDANGNMTTRVIGGITYTLTYDAENRLVSYVGGSGGLTINASFLYDGDGNRVQGTVNGVTIKYVGAHYEVQGSTVKKYYYAGGARIAMRDNGTLRYFLTDHLGSTTITLDANGNEVSELRYSAWGMTRFTSGTMPTTFQYTGQRIEPELDIYYYNARWYDPYLNRWLQPDSIIPDEYSSLDWDRYSYARNNPIKFNDPSGHIPACDKNDWECQFHWDDPVVEEEPYIPGPYDPIIELVVTSAIEPLDWMNMADSCMHGECSLWFLLSMAPLIPGSIGKYADDVVKLVPANTLHWSQKGISQATKDGLLLDDLAQSMAQGWKGDPLKVLEIDGKLVSLDNRRLTVAKMLDIDVPVTISKGHTVAELVTVFKRDGIFSQIPIRGTDMIIDMFGRLLER